MCQMEAVYGSHIYVNKARALARGPAGLGLREMVPWMERLGVRAARGHGKKCMLQQAYESGDLELQEAVRRHASGSPFPRQQNLGACSSSGHWEAGIPQIFEVTVYQRQVSCG